MESIGVCGCAVNAHRCYERQAKSKTKWIHKNNPVRYQQHWETERA